MEVKSSPASYSSAHDDLIYTVYDAHSLDSTTYPNYKYIADVYVDGTLVARLKKIQDPTTNIGIFNVGQVVRNYLSTSFSPTASQLVAQALGSGAFYVSVQVKFGEEYDFTNYLNVLTDTAIKVYNSYNTRQAGVAQILSQKVDVLATDRPFTGEVLSSSNYYFIPYFPTTTDPVDVVVTPNVGSTLTTTFTPAAYALQVLNISPGALNAVQAGTITAGTTEYTVEIGAETFTMSVICESIHTPYLIHFLNRYGGFESKIFSKVSRKVLDIQRKDFGKLNYTVDSSGQVSYKNSNGVYNESRSVYATQYKEKLTLNSDLLTDSEYTWLSDLILSPMVYLEDGSYFYPVVVTESNYEPKKTVNDELTNLTLSIEFGETNSSQYR